MALTSDIELAWPTTIVAIRIVIVIVIVIAPCHYAFTSCICVLLSHSHGSRYVVKVHAKGPRA